MFSKEIYNLFDELKTTEAPIYPKGGSKYLIEWNLRKEKRWCHDGYKWRQTGSLKDIPNMRGKLSRIIFYAYNGKNSWTYKFSKTCFVRNDLPDKILVSYSGDELLAKRFNYRQVNVSDYEDDTDCENKLNVNKGDRTLYIKNLPDTMTEEEILALHPDIRKVKLDDSKNNSHTKYALVAFDDSASAKGALEHLRDVIVNDHRVIVDVLSETRSISYRQASNLALSSTQDPRKLYVTGFGRSTTKKYLASIFPTSSFIHYPIHPSTNMPIGYAFIHYDDEEEARKVHESSQDLVVNDNGIIVMFGKRDDDDGSRRKRIKLEVNDEDDGGGGDDDDGGGDNNNDDDGGGDNDDDDGDDNDDDGGGDDNDDDGGGDDDGDNVYDGNQ